jgi:hypothetical protein
LGGAVIFLGGGWYLANNVLPKVTVNMTTQNVSSVINGSFTAKVGLSNVDQANMIVPAKQNTLSKSETKSFNATGKQLLNKSTGTLTIFDCSESDTTNITIPSGTIFTSRGFNFVTQQDVSVTPSTTTISHGVHSCNFDQPSTAVKVIAQNGGGAYNLSAASHTYSTTSFSSVYASGSAMSGGDDKSVTVVSQADCDGAKNALLNGKSDSYRTQLQTQLKNEGFTGLLDTFVATPGTVTCTPAVGAQASSATATLAFSSTMVGASTTGLTQLITKLASKNLASSQSVLSTGLDSANETTKSQFSGGSVSFDLSTTVVTGIKQDAQALAKSIEGMKKGDAQNYLQSQPGVTSVSLSYSPFWVTKAPSNPKHITVNFVNNGN